MIDRTGYELHRLETYAWGNFGHLQRIELHKTVADVGPLAGIDLKKAAVVAGQNGAGKTTLIDPIFCVLMPFENRISLGVIADAEKTQKRGTGRSVKDYVLGKHSSSDEDRPQHPEKYYSRSTGVSIALLVFKHREMGQMKSVARLWWYSDYNIKEDKGFVLIEGEASINDPNITNLVKEDGSFFESASLFRKGMKAKGRNVKPFETPTTFLQAASEALNYRPEDIILLNKAFYIKSIANIDTFVRDNMLLEVTKESVDRLCENIQRASEIFRMIKLEQLKLDLCGEILTALEESKRLYKDQFEARVELKLIDIVSIYRELKAAVHKRKTSEEKRDLLDRGLPDLLDRELKTEDQLKNVRAQISAAPVAEKLRLLEADRDRRQAEINKLETIKSEFITACRNLAIRPPKANNETARFKQDIKVLVTTCKGEIDAAGARAHELKAEDASLKAEKAKLEGEIAHYSRHATMIPPWLYEEKNRCIRELKLKSTDLMFVGELIEVPKQFEKQRRAAEAVLRPISRNLLCHPDALRRVEVWINENRLKANLTTKRINKMELREPPKRSIPSNSVLEFILIKPEAENPFFTYLTSWLRSSFWHQVVRVEDFNTENEKAVTLEGFVKSDSRTMTKYKDGFELSLGWDNTQLCNSLRARAREINLRIAGIEKELESITNKTNTLWLRNSLLVRLESLSLDFLDIEAYRAQLNEVIEGIENAGKKNPDYKKLLKREADLDKELKDVRDEISKSRSTIEHLESELAETENIVSAKSTSLAGAIATEIPGRKISIQEHFGSNEFVMMRLEELDDEIKAKDVEPLVYKTTKEKSIPSPQASNVAAALAMKKYEEQFKDPDLSYGAPNSEDSVDKLISQWYDVVEKVNKEGLPSAHAQFQEFYTDTLLDSTKAAISDINGEKYRIESDIRAINESLKLNNYERLANGELRFLQIAHVPTRDEQIKAFERELKKVQTIITAEVRVLPPKERAEKIMSTLEPFVKTLEDSKYRTKVVDARNHYSFSVKSWKRGVEDAPAEEMETFKGAGSDGKSGGQTAQLCYALLAASIACRFHFYDPVKGKDTLRIFLVDEFTGKFDSEKPQDIMLLLSSMGFQAVVLTPMSKLETLRGYTNRIVLVHKQSAQSSIAECYELLSDEEKSLLDSVTAARFATQASAQIVEC